MRMTVFREEYQGVLPNWTNLLFQGSENSNPRFMWENAYAFKLPEKALIHIAFPHPTPSPNPGDDRQLSLRLITQSRLFSRLFFLWEYNPFGDLGFMHGSLRFSSLYRGRSSHGAELLISKALNSWRHMPSASAFLPPPLTLILVSRFSLFILPLGISFTFFQAQQCI